MRYLAKLVSPLIQPLLQQKQDIENIIQKIIDETVCNCKHPKESIRELSDTEACGLPWLICMDCGLAEEGWGCGYKKLRHGEYSSDRISHKEFHEIATKKVYQIRSKDDD